MIVGREEELRILTEVVEKARTGSGSALVLHGEAGIGKSSLLAEVADRARGGLQVLTALGVETEQDLPFAGLHMLLAPVADRIGALPERQAAVLRTALGGADGPAGDRFQTGVALHALLGLLADDRPVLCLVDDAHWIDAPSADALLFTARRLHGEGVAVLFAARDGHAPAFPAPGVPRLFLPRLDREASAALLAAHAPDLPRQVSEFVLGEAAGNPLALKELPAAHREGALEPLGFAAGPDLVRHGFAERITALPPGTRTLVLLAALDSSGDLHTVIRAADLLGAGLADLEPAERKGLLHAFGDRLSFPHPLIRSAAVQTASLAERVAAHAALAEAIPDTGPGRSLRRALHRAAATTEPDESVARELEESAKNGCGTAVTAYERAARLSPAPADRGRRLALAARAAADTGDAPHAATLAAQAAPLVTDAAVRAELAQISALDPYFRGHPDTAARILFDGASHAAAHAPVKAAFMMLDATGAAWVSGRPEVVRSALATTDSLDLPDAADDARILREAAVGLARVALGLPGIASLHALYTGGVLRRLALMERACALEWVIATGDLPLAERLLTELADECRVTAVGVLPEVLRDLTRVRLLRGHLHDAHATAQAAERIAEETDQPFFAADARELRITISAWQGAITDDEPPAAARAALALARGELDEALAPLDAATRTGLPSAMYRYLLFDRAEILARLGRTDEARAALEALTPWAVETGQDWAHGLLARIEAHLSPKPAPLWEEALARLSSADRPLEHARTLLAHGAWLRRTTRPGAARPSLRTALEMFTSLGAAPWSERARAELRAAGDSAPAKTSPARPATPLSPQERHVVRLAAQGLTNRQIGERLFLSPRTVGYHLYNAYPKLGVSSRVELAKLDLPED